MKNKVIIALTAIIGITLSLFLFKNGSFFYQFFNKSNLIQKEIDNIYHQELILDDTILRQSVYMYSDYDEINKEMEKLNKKIKRLQQSEFFKLKYKNAYKKLIKYKKELEIKYLNIYKFERYNATLKNSTIFFLNYLYNLPLLMKGSHGDLFIYYNAVVKTVSNILLLKSTYDDNFLNQIDLDFFRNFNNEIVDKNNILFVAHLEKFYDIFPLYSLSLKEILNSKTKNYLRDIDKIVFSINQKETKNIKNITNLVIVFVFIYTVFSIILLIIIERDNIKLREYSKSLKYLAEHDMITGFYNRIKFDKDIKNINEAVFVLVNINGFRYINEYYGSDFGDKVLIFVANKLKEQINYKNANFYRIGGDDFGILLHKNSIKLKRIVENIIDYFENNECEIDGVVLKITIKIGVSIKKPFFENAAIALKKVKELPRVKYLYYKDEFDIRKEIEINIKRSKELYEAIKNDNLMPVFQPIVNLESNKIAKYEVLARLKLEDRLVSIFPYLNIAKENKLYEEITKIIITKAFKRFENSNIEFSVNFSIEDILDRRIWKLLAEYNKKSDILKQVTFEILESEAVNDYGEINKFIKFVKAMGAKVALDDFGSGYSNFEHIISMDLDFIKIDGSLIKNLDKDENSLKVVKILSQFSKDMEVDIVAEFVENEDIVKVLKSLGIKYGQGYFLGKPSEDVKF